MSKSFNAERLDVAAFAQAQAHLSGREILQKYERLIEEVHGETSDLMLEWQATGEYRRAIDGVPRPALHLQAQISLPLTCQLCMGEVLTPVHVDRHFLFVADEDTAAALDDDSEDDVLVLATDFDLHALIEDELLMALPLVPRHADCPDAPPLSVQDADFDAAEGDKPNPFAALAVLKKTKDE